MTLQALHRAPAQAPRKGERTRAKIVQRCAALMNRQGYLATSIASVIDATGIQKGGLYRHFESREALALEALDHAVGQVRERLLGAMQAHSDACEKLLAMIGAYRGAESDAVPLEGGCPIMNSAIEADHAHPVMRERARAAMTAWESLIVRVLEEGIGRGEVRPEVDPGEAASTLIACIEGGVMLAHLFNDSRPLEAAKRHLERYVTSELRARPAPRRLKR